MLHQSTYLQSGFFGNGGSSPAFTGLPRSYSTVKIPAAFGVLHAANINQSFVVFFSSIMSFVKFHFQQ